MSNGVGRLIAGRYRLGTAIGRGGMGIVWRAADEVLHREVAVKEIKLPPGLDDHERVLLCERTMREARSAARVRHAAIVAIYDVVDEDDRPWIVMELVDSRNLDQVIKEEGPLPPAQVAEIGRILLGALTAAHSAGVLHRDIKPANVLLTSDGRVVLTDFGLAVIDGAATLTQSGIFMGSPAYVAPEVAQGEKATVRSDLWSLGATLYAAVEGRSPYDRESIMATLGALLTEKPDPAQRPGPLRPALDGLLRKDPKARITPEAVARLLDLSHPGRGRRSARRRYALSGVAAAAAVAVIVTTAWAMAPEDDRPAGAADPPTGLEPGLAIADVTPMARETVGIGIPITVKFNRPVQDRARAERALRVASTKPTQGAWNWTGSDQAVFRTTKFWDPGQQVTLTAPGRSHRFMIGDANRVEIDIAGRRLTAFRGDAMVRRGPITARQEDAFTTTTTSGIHLVMGKSPSQSVTSDARGAGYFDVTVRDVLRISGSGQFIYSATSASAVVLGKANGTHGAVAVSPALARWLYAWVKRGDVITITGTKRKLEWTDGWGYWQLPWETWLRASTTKKPQPT